MTRDTTKACKQPPGVIAPSVDFARCEGKADCAAVCPENVFDIARGITEVLLNDSLREELIHKGRKQAARFSWARTAEAVLKLYEELGSKN